VILWYAAGAVFGVWNVFQSSGLDFRVVALGALLPLVADLPFGRQWVGHSLPASVVLLGLVMVVTRGRGRRLGRRRWIGLPIGSLSGLVLAGSWRSAPVFWWPAFGTDAPHLALLGPWPVLLVEEALGLGALLWAVRRFGLVDPVRRRTFWRTGRLQVVPT